MKNIFKIVGIALVAISVMSFSPYGSQESFVVIVNEGNPIQTMTASQVKIIYLRKINKRWKEINKNIIPVDRKGDPEIRKNFLKEILDFNSDDFSRYFTEREYQNAEPPPVKVTSDAEAIEYVENNLGAIAYVSKASISGAKVKVVFGN